MSNFIYEGQVVENMYDEIRDESLNNLSSKEENILRTWARDTGYTLGLAYTKNYPVVNIYTPSTCQFVGSRGTNLELLKTRWNEAFSGNWEIKLVPVSGIIGYN